MCGQRGGKAVAPTLYVATLRAYRQRDRQGIARSMFRAYSSVWEHHGRETRSAIQGTPSPTTRADLHCVVVEEGAKPLHTKNPSS